MSAFWQNVLSGLIVFVPTVALAVLLLFLDRRHERSVAKRKDDELRHALVRNLYLELLLIRAFVNAYLTMCRDARTNGRIANVPTHRPPMAVWEHSQHDLTRLGLPGRAGITVAIAYSQVVSLENWTDHIEAVGQNQNFKAMLSSQLDGLAHAEEVGERVDAARTEIENWAKNVGLDLVKDSGISERVRTKYVSAPTVAPMVPEKETSKTPN